MSDTIVDNPDSRTTTPPTIPIESGNIEFEFTPEEVQGFGRYDLLVEMGSGGMATLYLARLSGPEEFEKLLAIKKIHPHLAKQPSFVRMFLDEARIAALIDHPNVVSTFEMGNIGKSYFIAMEYVHGQNLTDLIKATVRQPDAFPWHHAARIIADAAAGLHAAHELTNARGESLSVVHRDVSPHNILVSYDGSVKVVDFGIAFASEKLEQTATGTVKGKAGYMSPQQAMGESLDRRSDIFSLGIVLWECVCRRRLFRRESEGATILAVREAKVAPMQLHRPGVPAELDRIAQQALAQDVTDRFQTMEDLSEALEKAIAHSGEVVQRRHVGRTVSRLFSDRRKLKDKQIQMALDCVSDAPIAGVGMGDTQSLTYQSKDDSASLTARTKRRSPLLGIVVGAVAVAIISALVLVFWNPFAHKEKSTEAPPSPPESSATRPMAAPPLRRAVPPSQIRLVVEVSPANAPVVVAFRGREHRGARFAVDVPVSSKPETIVVHAKGYDTQSVVVVPTSDTTIPITLKTAAVAPKQVRRRRRRRPRYRPRPRRRTSNMLRDLPD